MKTEHKYLVTSNASGVIFLNSNTGSLPTITLDGKKKVPFTEEQKLAYSEDLEIYGPKIVLEEYKAEKAGSSKKVTPPTGGKSGTSKKVSKKVTASNKGEVQKEIENKLDASAPMTKEEIMVKARQLKKQYAAETDKSVRKELKKKIETLLESINA